MGQIRYFGKRGLVAAMVMIGALAHADGAANQVIVAGNRLQVLCRGGDSGICAQLSASEEASLAQNPWVSFAGSGYPVNSGDGGPAREAGFFQPSAMAQDSHGNVIIASPHSHTIRVVCTQIGGVCAGLTDGVRLFAESQAGGNQPVRPGTVYHLAGVRSDTSTNPNYGFGSDAGCVGVGEQTSAQSSCLNFPEAVVVNAWDNVIIADTNNNKLRIVCFNPRTGDPLCADSEPGTIHTLAEMENPSGVRLDDGGNLLITRAGSDSQSVLCIDATRGACGPILDALPGHVYPLNPMVNPTVN